MKRAPTRADLIEGLVAIIDASDLSRTKFALVVIRCNPRTLRRYLAGTVHMSPTLEDFIVEYHNPTDDRGPSPMMYRFITLPN